MARNSAFELFQPIDCESNWKQDAGQDAEIGITTLVNLFTEQQDKILAEIHKELYIFVSLFIAAVTKFNYSLELLLSCFLTT